MVENVYKILTKDQWPLRGDEYPTDLDATDGFIHMSTSPQALKVANLYFPKSNTLLLLRIPMSKLQHLDLRWEAPAPPDASRKEEEAKTGEQFPHLYLPCVLSDLVSEVLEVSRSAAGSFDFDLPH
ncbi:hypothetical protein BC829DRAFT_448280 [Chytridium lagenaria]|nr:hypothetical protein BC829DRAFT_448280 [Chytridium lagenaria]